MTIQLDKFTVRAEWQLIVDRDLSVVDMWSLRIGGPSNIGESVSDAAVNGQPASACSATDA